MMTKKLAQLGKAAKEGHRQAKPELKSLLEKISKETQHLEVQAKILEAEAESLEAEAEILEAEYQKIERLRESAAQGNATAQHELGLIYHHLHWLIESSCRPNSEALGHFRSKASEWFQKAAQQGFAPAKSALCKINTELEETKPLSRKLRAGFDKCKINTEVEETKSQRRQKKRQKIARLQESAAEGNAEAQYELGLMYYHGQNVRQNYCQALKWFQKAAEQSFAPAKSALHQTNAKCEEAKRREAEERQEVEHQRQAEERRVAARQYWAEEYRKKKRRLAERQEIAQRIERSQRAAVQGNAEEQYNLGVVYLNGQDTSRDYRQAFEWFEKAAAQNHAQAQYELGMIYYHGRGVIKDDRQALNWLQKAADQDHEQAKSAIQEAERQKEARQKAERQRFSKKDAKRQELEQFKVESSRRFRRGSWV